MKSQSSIRSNESAENTGKCARGGCDNPKYEGHDFCLSCLVTGASHPGANHCCDNLPAIAE